MKPHTLILIFLGTLFFAHPSFCQQNVPVKRTRTSQIITQLHLDTSKTRQVAAIMASYKDSVKTVMAKNNLSDAAKRARIDQLIATKNNQLEGLLNPAQLDLVIPTTERKPVAPQKRNSPDSINRLKYAGFLQRELSIQLSKAKQVETILHTYTKGIQSVSAVGGASDKVKEAKIALIKTARDQGLSKILTTAQLDKVIPERVKNKAAVQMASINATLASQEAVIRNDYAQRARLMLKDTLLSKQVKDMRLAELIKERNEKLMKCWGVGIQNQGATTSGKKQ